MDSLEETLGALRAFIDERDWDQFHSPANLAKSIAIEAGELLECYQWNDDADRSEVQGEIADVLTYCFELCLRLELDPIDVVRDKLEVTRAKYPIDRFKGSSRKYDDPGD